MKGTSTLKVNEATVIEALQMMVDATFAAPAPKVSAVKVESTGRASSYDGVTLEVTLDVAEKPVVPVAIAA